VRYVIALLAGLLGLVVGWAIAAFAFLGIGGLIGVSDFEGKRAMLAFFAVGPVGGLTGFIAGLWAALRRRT
jgi:hypothetical protein